MKKKWLQKLRWLKYSIIHMIFRYTSTGWVQDFFQISSHVLEAATSSWKGTKVYHQERIDGWRSAIATPMGCIA